MAVYKRGQKGVFYMNFMVNGHRVFKSTGKFTKKEAKLVEAVEKKKLMEDASLSPRERRAKTMLSEAIKNVYNERWKDNKDGLGACRNVELVMKYIGDMPLGKIDEEVVADLIRKLEARGNKPGTINRLLAALKTTLRHHRQAWDHIKLKREPKGRIRVITDTELVKVLELLRQAGSNKKKFCYPEVADLIEVLVDTGCRISEMLNLKYLDINFESNLISIWINKGEKPRSIPMTTRVRNIMLARKVDKAIKPFTISIDQAERAWDWVRAEMGLKHDREFVLHTLRHTCASRLVNQGIDLYIVKEWLGHSTIQITERYAHLSPSKLMEAANALENK